MNKPAESFSLLIAMRFCALVTLAALVSSCNQTQLPIGAELTISPSSKTWNIFDRRDSNGFCRMDPDIYVDQPVVLALRDSDGSPIADTKISVYVDLSGNTSPQSTPPLALYDDRRGNNNGVIDDFELVSGNDDSIAIVSTDYFGGDRPLLLRINVSCPYRGDVFAFADGVSASANIEVIVEEDDEKSSELKAIK